MIGHYLLTLTPDQEDRVLTHTIIPGAYQAGPRYGPCLIGVACANIDWEGEQFISAHSPGYHLDADGNEDDFIGQRYDDLCENFGVRRINEAIRNRILANRVWRALQGVVLQEEAVWE